MARFGSPFFQRASGLENVRPTNHSKFSIRSRMSGMCILEAAGPVLLNESGNDGSKSFQDDQAVVETVDPSLDGGKALCQCFAIAFLGLL